jgi:hypothetical protein
MGRPRCIRRSKAVVILAQRTLGLKGQRLSGASDRAACTRTMCGLATLRARWCAATVHVRVPWRLREDRGGTAGGRHDG